MPKGSWGVTGPKVGAHSHGIMPSEMTSGIITESVSKNNRTHGKLLQWSHSCLQMQRQLHKTSIFFSPLWSDGPVLFVTQVYPPVAYTEHTVCALALLWGQGLGLPKSWHSRCGRGIVLWMAVTYQCLGPQNSLVKIDNTQRQLTYRDCLSEAYRHHANYFRTLPW